MVFKTIESDITRSGQSLSIFGKEIKNIYRDFSSAVDGIKNKTGNISQFSIGRIFGNKLSQQDIQAIKNYNEEIKKYNQMTDDAVSPQTAFYKCLGNSSSAAQQLAREANGAAVSEELLTQNTQTLTFAQKASAAASQVMGVALNMALNLGIGLIISAIISGITKLVNKQKELAEQAKESAEKYNEQTKSLEELKKKYEEICKSTDDEKTKNEQLDEIKQELIKTYKVEEDHLKNLNLERENGNKLLEKEIKLANKRERGKWLGDNEEAITRAETAIETSYSGNKNGIISVDDLLNGGKINLNNISKSILDMFENVKHYEYGVDDVALLNQYTAFDVGGDDLIEKYEKIQDIIIALGNQTERTDEEEQLLKLLNKESDAMEKVLSVHRKTYETSKKAKAENLFDNYTDNNPLAEDNGRDAYLSWKNGLLETAKGDKYIEKNLIELAEDQFPDYAKYFENLDKAKSKFTAYEGTNKYNFIKNLSDEDLDILVNKLDVEDPFKDGLEGASKLIQEFKSDPNNKIGISFDYSSYSEQVDDVVKNVDKVQSALDKLNSGKGIDNKDITELANAFPDYSSKILSAADNTEKLKSVLSEIKSNAPSGLINTLRNLKDLSADDQDAVNGLIAILSNLNSISSKYADTLADLETKEGLLSTAYKEMHDDGQISLSTYQKLIDTGIDYSKAIENVNGKITVNVEKLKELTKAKYNDEIQTLELAKAEIGRNMASNPKYYMEQIDAINDDIKAKKEAMKLLDAYDYTTTSNKGKTEKPQSVLDFEKELAEKEHEIAMGQREENEDYYSWLLSAAHTAYDGLADYQDDLWKYEEKVYEWRKKNEQDLFDQKIENAKTLADKILNDKVEVPEEAKKLAEFNKKMQKEYGLGNVDLTKRPKVSADAMRKAGYDAEDGETATVYSSFDFLWQGDEEHGKYVAVHYTPILPDGTVLDEKTLNDYLNTLVGSDDILKADTKGIILKVDSDVDVSDADVKSLETDKPTENIQNIAKACDDWDIALHEVQAEWLDLSDAAEKAGTTAANKWDYAREIVNGYITDTQNRIKELENSGGKDNKDKIKSLKKDLESYKDDPDEIDEKEIKFNVEQTKKDLKKIDKEIEKIENDSITSDGTKLFGKEKWDTIESMYVSAAQKVQDQIDAIVKSGVKGNEDLLEELGETLDNYGDKIAELPKSAVKEEQEYLKNQKEKASKQIDEEINAVQKKIDALKKVNEKEQEALEIEKARQELEKASQSTRQVYGADGSISFKVDDEKVKEAQENLDKILLEQQTSILEEQKDLLETEKDNSEKRFDILLDVLDEYLNPDQGESNSDVWKELAHTEGATYKNGVWTDKDGKAIDINKLLETSETAKKEDNLGVGKKPDDTRDALKGSLRKDNNKDDVIRGHLTRQNIGNETSDVKDVADTTGSVVESFFSNLEKKLGLKDGSLSLDKVSSVLNGSNKMGYNPYAAMTERVGTVGSEYANANNVNNNVTNITIGDIVINNPVGNSDDLAKELRANLHNAADKIIYSNLR